MKGKRQKLMRHELIKNHARDVFRAGDVTSDGLLSEKRCCSYIRKLKRDHRSSLPSSVARIGAKGTSAIERGGMMKRVICLRGPKILTVLNTKNIGCGCEAVKAWQRQMHPLVAKARECMRKCWPVALDGCNWALVTEFIAAFRPLNGREINHD